MTSAQLVNLKGKSVGEVNLDDSVFGIEPNGDILYGALIRQLANARAGTANSKTRSEVSGGGRKPWRQKGTGRARAGSIRSPLWAGGGVAFGPRPRDYSISMPKKMRQLALKSALSAKKDVLVVVKDFADIKEAKTKHMVAAMKDLGLSGKKTLLVLDYQCDQCTVVERSARNIEAVKVVHVNNLSVKDIIDADAILTFQRVIEVINNRFKAEAKDATAGGAAAGAKKAPKAPKAEVTAEAPKAKAKAKAAEPDEAEAKPKAAPKKKAEAAEPEAKAKAAPKKKAEPAAEAPKPAKKKKSEE